MGSGACPHYKPQKIDWSRTKSIWLIELKTHCTVCLNINSPLAWIQLKPSAHHETSAADNIDEHSRRRDGKSYGVSAGHSLYTGWLYYRASVEQVMSRYQAKYDSAVFREVLGRWRRSMTLVAKCS